MIHNKKTYEKITKWTHGTTTCIVDEIVKHMIGVLIHAVVPCVYFSKLLEKKFSVYSIIVPLILISRDWRAVCD